MKIIDNDSVRSLVLVAALSIGMAIGPHASAQDLSYLIDLKTRTATGLGNVEASAINNVGQVVGSSYDTNHAFITGPNGVGMTGIGTLGGRYSGAYDINAAGQVVGSSGGHGFFTGPDGMGVTDLGTLGERVVSANSINDAGQVAGNSFDGFGAFITGPNGVGMTELDTLKSQTYVTGINSSGQVVGWSGMRAFITGPDGVGVTDLGTLGGRYSRAFDINASGQVVGISYTGAGEPHAFITGPDGVGMTDLGTRGSYSRAFGINDDGQVVGAADSATGRHAFITGPNGVGMTDLNSLVDLPAGVILGQAVAINNMGQVVAIVPEPASYALMLAGLALIGVMVRGRQKS